MADYEAVIGLEVHAQLKTNTKLFCSCSTEFGKEPNSNVCPVCTGQPGSLPVLNRKAVEYAVKMALAIDCTVKEHSVFARKNYFYPDLPMGYQISQFDLPFSEHGKVDIEVGGETKTIGVTRIHMENDAGKSIHSHAENASFVDLNRAGTPLIEIVSEPDMRSADEAVAYLKALHSILLYLGICDGNMEEGNFRCDANVSIRPRGQKEFGTRAELKNMNSFRNVHRAITYEIARQEDLLEDGEKVIQETRLFDADRGVTASMRGKEEAHDYRYFPDPDLVPLVLEREWIEKLRSELPELPAARLARFIEEYALPQADAEVLTGDRALADYFEAAVKAYDKPKKISNWVMTDVLRMLNETGSGIEGCGFAPEDFAKLVRIVDEGVINQKVGKQVFTEMFAEGGDPEAYVKDKGLVQISDTGALETAIDEIIAENPSEAEAFRGGKTKLMGFFVGQVMRKTKGQANPKLVNQILADKLK